MFEEVTFNNGPVRLHAVTAGPRDGQVVILLHGFPEFWYGWRRQITALAEAGYRVIAPDQRGYNLSTKPTTIEAYTITNLVADVIAIADQAGAKQIFLAGHDWGGAVAWVTAAMYPDRIARLTILNVPHPATMRYLLRHNPRQMRRSWYFLYFQIPYLPEAGFSARNYQGGKSALINSSWPGTFSEEDLARYRDAWAQPGALTGMINWYRAFFRTALKGGMKPMPIEVPTRILWGEKDAFILPEAAEDSLKHCARGELIKFPDCTHWLHHEEPDRVSRLLFPQT